MIELRYSLCDGSGVIEKFDPLRRDVVTQQGPIDTCSRLPSCQCSKWFVARTRAILDLLIADIKRN